MGTAALGSITYGLSGPNSQSFQGTASDLVSTATNAVLVANSLPSGPLKTFLSATYADTAAVNVAFRALGGRIDIRQISGTAPTSTLIVVWVASTSTPSFSMTAVGSTDGVYEFTFAVLHSMVQ